MPASKRLRTPLIVMFGVIMAMVAFATPANAASYATQPTFWRFRLRSRTSARRILPT